MSPCDYKNYPANWKSEIVPRIRERAGNKCEWCGVLNLSVGFRKPDSTFIQLRPNDNTDMVKVIKIVCTVMHLNHDLSDSSDENLKFACQRCHNRYDRSHRNLNASNTRDRIRGQLRIEDTP